MASSSRLTHQSLARRLLFPSLASNLPQLLASDVPPDLQSELYDFLALALRAYVSPWWTKITRYDKHFLPHTSHTISVVIRQLETRLLALDLPALTFHDLPAILTQHYRDYRNAASKLSSSYATGGAAPLPQLFHHLQPHIAITPDGCVDLEYYRQIVDHILKACLPPEDYAPEAERFIIREVIVKVLVNDVIPRVTQPWFIQRTILDLLEQSDQDRLFKSPDPPAQHPTASFSFHNFIVLVLSVLQSFSSTCLTLIHAYKQAITTIKLVNQSPAHTPSASPLLAYHQPEPFTANRPRHSRIPSKAPSISSTPSVTSSISYPSPSVLPHSHGTPVTLAQPDPLTSLPSEILQQPQYEHYASQPLILFSEVFLTSERLSATAFMTFLGMISATMMRFLDKLLPHLLYSFLSPGFILNLVRLSKRTMFPNGYPGPPPIDPTPEEQAEMRQRLVEWKGSGGLSHLIPLLLGTESKQTLNAAIEPLTCQPCNAHLLVILLDRLVVGLFPELVGAQGYTNIAGVRDAILTDYSNPTNNYTHVHENSASQDVTTGSNDRTKFNASGLQGLEGN